MAKLTVFYDGLCPLCVKEMKQLAKLDEQGYLGFFDINQNTLASLHPDIDYDKANAYLHAKTDSGAVITGLDVTYYAWKLVGKGAWLAPLRWPGIRFIADRVYLLFARNRYQVSKWLTGRARCEQACEIQTRAKRVNDDKS